MCALNFSWFLTILTTHAEVFVLNQTRIRLVPKTHTHQLVQEVVARRSDFNTCGCVFHLISHFSSTLDWFWDYRTPRIEMHVEIPSQVPIDFCPGVKDICEEEIGCPAPLLTLVYLSSGNLCTPLSFSTPGRSIDNKHSPTTTSELLFSYRSQRCCLFTAVP